MTTIQEKGKTYEAREVTFQLFDGKPFIKTPDAIVALATCPWCSKKVGLTLGKQISILGIKKMVSGCDAWCMCGTKFYATQLNLDNTTPKYWCRSKLQVGAIQ